MRITRVEATPLAIPLAQEFHWAGGAQVGANLVLFTVHTDGGWLGSSFIAWSDGSGTFLVTANHVVAHETGANVTVSRKSGTWQADIVHRDPAHDLRKDREGHRHEADQDAHADVQAHSIHQEFSRTMPSTMFATSSQRSVIDSSRS